MDGHWEDEWCWGSVTESHLELLSKKNKHVDNYKLSYITKACS